MSYQEDNKNKELKKYRSRRRMLALIIFLGIPVAIGIALSYLNISGSLKMSIIGMAPFIFPAMVILMIPIMIKDMKSGAYDPEENEIDNEQATIE